MCDLGSGLAKKHYTNGFDNGQIKSIKNLMNNLNFSADKVMEALGVAQKDRLRYAEMIKTPDKINRKKKRRFSFLRF